MNLLKVTSLILSLLIFNACGIGVTDSRISVSISSNENNQNLQQNKQKAKKTVTNAIIKKEQQDKEIIEIDIKNSLGLVNLENYKADDFIRIYNQDGSLWYKFIYFDDKGNSVTKFEKNDFHPFRNDLDDFHMVLNCIGQDKLYYHIIVNENTGLKKYLRKDDQMFKFGTWEQYILNCFAVEFNNEQNPLREKPNGRLTVDNFSRSLTFHTEEIKGEWLKVSWYDNDDRNKRPKFGWVRWKKDKKIVINFFETA